MSRLATNLLLAVVVVVTVAVLLSLGFWQLQRAEDKRAVLQARDTQRAMPALQISSVQQSLPEFRAVTVSGQFDAERFWLLENRIHQGRYGFEVVSPFELTGGETLLVHRGWIPGDRSRREIPTVETPAGLLEITGYIDAGSATGFELSGASVDAGWPKRVQWLPVARAEAALDRPLPDVLLRLQAGEPGMFVNTYQAVNMPPEKHVGYAVQWFGMATIIGFLYLLHLWRQRSTGGKGLE